MRYVGAKGKDIQIVSDKQFSNDKLNILEVPSELDDIKSDDLIINYKIKDNKILHKKPKKPAKDLKVAYVGNWKMYCGISTYNEFLLSALTPKLGDFKLFVEETPITTEPMNIIGGKEIPPDKVEVCWKRGENLNKLISAIKEYDPDVIIIGHEFGLWPNARYWLSMLNQLSDYRIIVTLHSVFHHKDKTIVEAAIPEIIVHLEGAKKVLKEEKELSSKIYVIPHGCTAIDKQEKLWNFYKSNQTFFQFGFSHKYKNYEIGIKTVALLKDKYPEVFFTALLSESPYSMLDHEIYYRELMDLVCKLNVQDNVALIRGFQSEVVLDSYLKTNKACLFPYNTPIEHEVFGASGAARFCMTRGIPVVTSKGHHFDDLPTIKTDSPEEMAKELDKLFSDWKVAHAQVLKQNQYIEENSWEITAQRYISILENP